MISKVQYLTKETTNGILEYFDSLVLTFPSFFQLLDHDFDFFRVVAVKSLGARYLRYDALTQVQRG